MSVRINRVQQLKACRELRRERRGDQICVGGMVGIHVITPRDFDNHGNQKFFSLRHRLERNVGARFDHSGGPGNHSRFLSINRIAAN